MEQDIQNDMKLVRVYVDYMELFITVNNDGTKTNVDVNAKN